jgi:pimeloyl-ACP methyl ester carboxylesterase
MTVLARLVWRRPYNPRLATRLHRIQCPTLLLWGDHDRLVPPAYGEAYRKGLPHAEMALLPNCGHLPMFEMENEYVERVLRFAQANS